MRYRKSGACVAFAVLVVGVSLPAAQSERRGSSTFPTFPRPR